MSEQYEQIDHPQHYQIAPGVETIDLCEPLGFNIGNAVKYLCRAGKKPGGDRYTDLKKAAWYIDRELGREVDLAFEEDAKTRLLETPSTDGPVATTAATP